MIHLGSLFFVCRFLSTPTAGGAEKDTKFGQHSTRDRNKSCHHLQDMTINVLQAIESVNVRAIDPSTRLARTIVMIRDEI
jgi:hypothetical protein